jgi:hypothetical protein
MRGALRENRVRTEVFPSSGLRVRPTKLKGGALTRKKAVLIPVTKLEL